MKKSTLVTGRSVSGIEQALQRVRRVLFAPIKFNLSCVDHYQLEREDLLYFARVTLFGGMAERWNGGTEWRNTRNILKHGIHGIF